VTGRNDNYTRPQYGRATPPRRRNGIRPAVTARGREELELTLKRSRARVFVLRVQSSQPTDTGLDEWRDRKLAA